ncbi:hypothetical protein evm_014060 [Chilo suppressalis]|nr:hypothetical protein evm_014060 [Chilo suppressalis]
MSKRGRTLNSQAPELVVKLHEYFERECQNDGTLLPVTQVRDRVGEALGIGSRTVGKILSEKYGPSGSDSNVLHTPKKRNRTKPVTDDSEASCSKVPIGKGGRLIICHAGSASAGFVENSILAFQPKSTKEYHEEMDAERFQEWFLNLLTNIPPNSTIIMDNAPYHSVQIDKAPTSANKKADLVAWLQRKGVEADMSLLKAELLHLVKLHKPPRPTYAIDQLAEEHGHKVIRLPPYHCQYNAIELIWAQVKGYAARHNTKPPFSVKKMEGLLKEACAQVTQEDWSKIVEKTKKIIMDDFDRDVKFDDFMDNQLVINLNDDDDEDDNDSSTCSE